MHNFCDRKTDKTDKKLKTVELNIQDNKNYIKLWKLWKMEVESLELIEENSPNRLDISELCIFGLSCAIFLRWRRLQTCKLRDHISTVIYIEDIKLIKLTIKAFIGRFMWSSTGFFIKDDDVSKLKMVEL